MFNESENSAPKTGFDYEIDFIQYSNKTFLYGIYIKLSYFENHFDNIATRYRNIALTWLLATYAGIGFLLSTETETLIIDHLLAVLLICFIGMLGITLIWHLDVNVYHRFWTALFAEEVIMEEQYAFLPQIQRTTLLIDKDRDKLFSQGWLYITAILLLAITVGVALCTVSGDLSRTARIGWLLFLVVLSASLLTLMIRCGKLAQKTLEQLLERRRKEVK